MPGRESLWQGEDDWLSKGNSTIVGPKGEILAGPLIGEGGILYAEVDAARARAVRHEFDPVGHYSRPDVFTLNVETGPRPQAVSGDGSGVPPAGVARQRLRPAATTRKKR